jgi:DNA-binding response OmpR family regulator
MDADSLCAKIGAETLVLHRRGDRAIPFEAGRRLAAALPKVRFVALDGDAHPPWFRSGNVAHLIREFLGDPNATIAAPEVGVATNTCEIDVANRALLIDGERIATTPLEWGVMQQLTENRGRIVTRDDLLEKIWNTPFAGSNKVEAVIRTLRKKLGPYAASIETVTGHGYRFQEWRRGTAN